MTVSRFLTHLAMLWFDEEAASIAEYSIVLAVFSAVMLASLRLIGNLTGNKLNNTSNGFTNLYYTP